MESHCRTPLTGGGNGQAERSRDRRNRTPSRPAAGCPDPGIRYSGVRNPRAEILVAGCYGVIMDAVQDGATASAVSRRLSDPAHDRPRADVRPVPVPWCWLPARRLAL